MNNLFRYANEPDFFNPALWLGSRGGARSYCGADDGHGFGSSVDNSDFADFNLVMGNQLLNRDPDQKIWDRGEGNTVVQNVRVGVGALGPPPAAFSTPAPTSWSPTVTASGGVKRRSAAKTARSSPNSDPRTSGASHTRRGLSP